ncbi:SRPBCC family protein [Lentzea aerocolonigenes]|uniref:SRPBCC family protein n=1 Tax=Lentzea aerocolonigenes TaxID=68170 RepID=UPI0005EBF641|nr:SRPBCC family protein [Lentzea aerocolonigenes]
MTDRSYEDGKLVIRRHYKAVREDVWDAITSPERLVRWFLPISGELRPGGRYQLEGNAGGRIIRCDKPSEIGLTWEIGEMNTDVLVRLEADGDATILTLTHSPMPGEFVPGTGAGWELGLIAMEKYLAGDLPEGRALDWIAASAPEDLAAAHQLAEQIAGEWAGVLG